MCTLLDLKAFLHYAYQKLLILYEEADEQLER